MTNTFVRDESLKKTEGGDSRTSREMSDNARTGSDGTITTVAERRRAFLNEWQQQALPTVPEIPGFHLCWLSTTSTYDPIHKRMRMGYVPVKASEVEGLESLSLKAGEWKGFIGANEMLLFKIPNEVYQELMAEFHHYQPLEQEQAIKSSLPTGQRDNNGKKLASVEGEGFDSLAADVSVPNFVN